MRAFRKQSQEVSAIERQVKDQQELTRQQAKLLEIQSGQLELLRQQFDDQLAERRRAQASRVIFWTETSNDPQFQGRKTAAVVLKSLTVHIRKSLTVHIRNESQRPVHDVDIIWHQGSGLWGELSHFQVIWPGGHFVQTKLIDRSVPNEDYSKFGAKARFRDAAGVRWLRHPDGRLDEEPPSGNGAQSRPYSP